MADAYLHQEGGSAMTMVALLSWIVVGAVLGAVLASLWKIRGLTLAWGIATGGVGGVVGGLLGRMVFPESLFADGLAVVTAIVGGAVAMLVARARVATKRSSAV
jgi:uncharacterized membrane protein YeaQ/YmgE (transglycosylase-associated protein family)